MFSRFFRQHVRGLPAPMILEAICEEHCVALTWPDVFQE